MDKIIEKWEKIIEKNRGEDINYSRGVLEQMLNDFKRQVKSFAIPCVVGGSETTEQLLAYHEWYLKNRNTVISSDPKTMVEMYLSQ